MLSWLAALIEGFSSSLSVNNGSQAARPSLPREGEEQKEKDGISLSHRRIPRESLLKRKNHKI